MVSIRSYWNVRRLSDSCQTCGKCLLRVQWQCERSGCPAFRRSPCLQSTGTEADGTCVRVTAAFSPTGVSDDCQTAVRQVITASSQHNVSPSDRDMKCSNERVVYDWPVRTQVASLLMFRQHLLILVCQTVVRHLSDSCQTGGK